MRYTEKAEFARFAEEEAGQGGSSTPARTATESSFLVRRRRRAGQNERRAGGGREQHARAGAVVLHDHCVRAGRQDVPDRGHPGDAAPAARRLRRRLRVARRDEHPLRRPGPHPARARAEEVDAVRGRDALPRLRRQDAARGARHARRRRRHPAGDARGRGGARRRRPALADRRRPPHARHGGGPRRQGGGQAPGVAAPATAARVGQGGLPQSVQPVLRPSLHPGLPAYLPRRVGRPQPDRDHGACCCPQRIHHRTGHHPRPLALHRARRHRRQVARVQNIRQARDIRRRIPVHLLRALLLPRGMALRLGAAAAPGARPARPRLDTPQRIAHRHRTTQVS